MCYDCYVSDKIIQKLISKSQLARVAGVSKTAITRAVKKELKAAMKGARVDENHPTVQKFIAKNKVEAPVGPAQGIDPLYQDAVDHCQVGGRFTVSTISRGLKIGYSRAEQIFKMMQVAGTDKPCKAPPPPPPSIKKSTPTGTAAKRNTKKKESLDNLKKRKSLDNLNQGTVLHEIPDDIKDFVNMTLGELIKRFGTDIAFLDWLKATKSIEDINEKRLKNATTRGELVSRHLIKVGVFDHVDRALKQLLSDGAETINKRVRTMTKAGRDEKETKKFIVDQMASFIKPMKVKITRTLKNA